MSAWHAVPMVRRPRSRTGVTELDQAIEALVEQAGLDDNQDLYLEMLTSVLRMGRERTDRGDVKIINSALKELRNAFDKFDPLIAEKKAAGADTSAIEALQVSAKAHVCLLYTSRCV